MAFILQKAGQADSLKMLDVKGPAI